MGREIAENRRMFLADLHVHSNFSDGSLTIAELVDLYGRKGFGAIAVTDHVCERHTFLGQAAKYLEKTLTQDTFPRYMDELLAQAERAERQYGMVVIPGLELTKNSFFQHRSAHILGLGVREFISADLPPLEIVRAIRAKGGCAIAAHPVPTRKYEAQTFYLWNRREEYRHEFDAWEVASGKVWFKEVEDARLPTIASSDLHHPKQMSSWKTGFKCARNERAILQAIRDQELTFHFYEESLNSSEIFFRPQSLNFA